MKHEALLKGSDWLPRDTRVEANYDVLVQCEAGDIDAAVVNLSSEGFRLHSRDPLVAGWEVSLSAPNQDPIKAVICWASGYDSGGVFLDAVAL